MFNFVDSVCKQYKKGDPGPPGPSPAFVSASAVQLPYGNQPTVVIGGTSPNLTITFGIPAGAPGGTGGTPGTGDVVGPASATNNHVAVFDGVTGKLIKDGGHPAFDWDYNSLNNKPTSMAPTGHANSHKSGGSDPLALSDLGVPANDVSWNGKKITNLALATNPNDAVRKGMLDAYVVGPAFATNGRMVVFDGTSGKLVKEGPVLATVATTGDFGDLSGFYTEDALSAFLDGAADPFLRTSAYAPGGGGTGDVVGPANSANNEIALYSGTTGKLIKRGSVVGNAAYKNVGTTAGTVAAGDDPRFDVIAASSVKHLLPYARKSGFGVFDLEEVYGLNAYNGPMKLNQLYTTLEAQAKFPKLFQWYVAAGMSTVQVMSIRHGAACANEAVLQGHTDGNIGSGKVNSLNTVIWPRGVFPCNIAVMIDAGGYIGKGTHSVDFHGEDVPNASNITLDHVGWLEPGKDMTPFQTTTTPGFSLYNYVEGGYVSGFRFIGPYGGRYHDTSVHSSGMLICWAGEVFRIGDVKMDGFNDYGLELIGATPILVDNISVFLNRKGGIGAIGSALSTMRFGMVSADDNPAIFRVDSNYNGTHGAAGGNISVGGVKEETNYPDRPPAMSQILLWADGNSGTGSNDGAQLNFTAENVAFAYNGASGRRHAACVVKGFSQNAAGGYSGASQARVKVGGMKGWNYDYLLHCLRTGNAWAARPDYEGVGLEWNASTGTLARGAADGSAGSPVAVTTAGVKSLTRLGLKDAEPSWNDVAVYDITNSGTPGPFPSLSANDTAVGVGVVPAEIHVGQTAALSMQRIDRNRILHPGGGAGAFYVGYSYSIGNGTIAGTTFTATSPGIVQIRGVGSGCTGIGWINILP